MLFKCISSINLSPPNKSLFTISFILYNQNKTSSNNGTLLNGVLRPRLLNIHCASCFFINIVSLHPHTSHFHNNIVLPSLVFQTLEFMFSLSFLHFKQ